MKTSGWATFTFKDIVWIAIIVLIVLFLSKCHRDKTDAIADQVKAVSTKHEQDSIAHAAVVSVLNNQIVEAEGNARKAEVAQGVIQNTLDQSIATSQRLAKAVNIAKGFPVNASFIPVSTEYVDYCDSLAIVSDRVAGDYSAYKLKTGYLILSKDTLIRLKDQALAQEKTYLTECRKDYNALMHFYTQSEKQNKPRNQVYVGAELLGNRQSLISAVGAALSLKTKGNKLWQISGGIQSGGGYYGRINGNILIRLRKN